MNDIYILAIETSCDETSMAIVKNGKEIESLTVLTQMDIHANYGGVVPEIASRLHTENITMVLEETLKNTKLTMEDISAIAVTYAPGLLGSLLIGIECAKALALVLPELKGKLHGMALRVPTPNVSLVDLVVDLQKDVTVEEVNAAFIAAAEGPMKGILNFSMEPLVSSDYNTTTYSSTIDGLTTMVMGDRKVKVLAWYDNEWGYSARVVDLAKKVVNELATVKA